ncbi:MAG: hypothetical protein JW839_12530 [Candidatus Lokiarchaeota archaeon]|nr:hypothetical protein [Candidatus Lokiarchaeota archaeon]
MNIELLIGDQPAWNEKVDLLDLTAPIQVYLNGKPLPEKYFGGGIVVNLFETAFEILDLLGNLERAFKAKDKVPDALHQAELCYTGNFLTAQAVGPGNVRVAMQFNPAAVDDEALLAGSPDYQEQVSFSSLATELLLFAISVYEALVEFNPSFEDKLVDMKDGLITHQETLEKEFKVVLPTPPEEK